MARGTILVVDDEKPIAEILRYHLIQEGYEVSLAFDGEAQAGTKYAA